MFANAAPTQAQLGDYRISMMLMFPPTRAKYRRQAVVFTGFVWVDTVIDEQLNYSPLWASKINTSTVQASSQQASSQQPEMRDTDLAVERGYVHCRKPVVIGQLSVGATLQQYRHSVPLSLLRCQHERGKMLRSFGLGIDIGTAIQRALNLDPAVLIDRGKQCGVSSWGLSRRRLYGRQQHHQQVAQ